MVLNFSFLNNNYWLSTLDLCGLGDESDFERRMDDLKLLYRAYVTDALAGGRLEENKVNSVLYKIFYTKAWLRVLLRAGVFRCCVLYQSLDIFHF